MNIDLSRCMPNIRVEELGFDFDGVIADTATAFLQLACRDYGYCEILRDQITSFQLEDCLDIPMATVETIFTDIMNDSLATGLQPIDGSIPALCQLSRSAPVTIITARPLAQPVHDWLDHFLPTDTRSDIKVIATGDHDDKMRYIRAHNLHYFIDDRVETCHQLRREGICPIVFSQPWNRGQHALSSVANWQEILAMIASD